MCAGRTLSNDRCVVLDDVLTDADCDRLYAWAEQREYRRINTAGAVDSVWGLSSGFPLRGTDDVYRAAARARMQPHRTCFPVGDAVDTFVHALDAAARTESGLVGEEGPDGWHHYSITPWVYPPGTGLDLHTDGSGVYSGAYVYYLNPRWKPHWGGHLVVMDRGGVAPAEPRRVRNWLHGAEGGEPAGSPGIGLTILPKRNRLVLLAPDCLHMVTKVQPECGDEVRVSLAGFFHRSGLWQRTAPRAKAAADPVSRAPPTSPPRRAR